MHSTHWVLKLGGIAFGVFQSANVASLDRSRITFQIKWAALICVILAWTWDLLCTTITPSKSSCPNDSPCVEKGTLLTRYSETWSVPVEPRDPSI